MKYIKYFEDVENEDVPEMGDYVICVDEEGDTDQDEFHNFLENTIGTIIAIKHYDNQHLEGDFFHTEAGHRFDGWNDLLYLVQFEKDPEPEYMIEQDFPERSLIFTDREILKFSKNKEDLEIFINANKYNL